MFSAVNFALEKRRNEIINTHTSSLSLFSNVDHKKNVKRTFNFLPNIGPISEVSDPTPLTECVLFVSHVQDASITDRLLPAIPVSSHTKPHRCGNDNCL